MPNDSLIGRRLDEYRLEALLGQGGMARVYRGLDVRLKRWVAIKVIDAPFRADSDYIKRFEREAQAIAQLEHPHIVRLYRYGEVKELLYMAMQYVEGAPLSELLASYQAEADFIEPAEAGRIIREVCLALDYAHSQGVIHRDVKPANIILTKQGSAVLTDFGLALLTDVGTRGEIFGTPHYMAPEQAMSSAGVVPQSDLYAVGVILYEMFTGRVPFDAATPLDVAMLQMSEPPPRPRQFRADLKPALEKVILKALAKDPRQRYPNGAALAEAVEQALKAPRAKAAPAARPRKSIPERVAVSMAKRPLPPLPAAVAAPPPKKKARPAAKSAPIPAPSPQPNRRLWLYLAAAGLILLLGLGWLFTFAPVGVSSWWFLNRPDEAVLAGQLTPTSSPAVVADELSPPTPTPSATPPPEPKLLADTRRDFSGTRGAWDYLWSPPGQDKWTQLKYETRQYGACWYGQDYIRICADSAHPGNGADIAWFWQSEVSGPLEVRLTAAKRDAGGDGVSIAVYRNTTQTTAFPEFKKSLAGNDQGGFAEKFQLDNITPGDYLLFVIQHNGEATSDHTAFQALICHYRCP
ncbi:MAG: hypothetical protein DPW09_07425 [Anaerolineae bacterium]|nr:serine/threonine protein kinase [Anaerolineales bacterium]MCQ3973258.1 hypothetical protein [Anaerolineae bacterium]